MSGCCGKGWVGVFGKDDTFVMTQPICLNIHLVALRVFKAPLPSLRDSLFLAVMGGGHFSQVTDGHLCQPHCCVPGPCRGISAVVSVGAGQGDPEQGCQPSQGKRGWTSSGRFSGGCRPRLWRPLGLCQGGKEATTFEAKELAYIKAWSFLGIAAL